MIYLDYAANTPTNEEVYRAFYEANKTYIANPNANHQLGKKAQEAIRKSTHNIALLLGVEPEEIIYTSGATEANNLAITGSCQQYRAYGKHIITTYLEHSSVTGPVAALQKQGYEVDFVDITPTGEIDLNHLKELLRADTVLVSISYVDSELGIIQPIEAISKMIKAMPHCLLHVDGTQAIGKIPITLEAIDLFTFAPHKFEGLNGVGILIKKKNIFLEPLIHGGVSTTPFRSGTPTVALILSTEVALDKALANQSKYDMHVKGLNAYMRQRLGQIPCMLLNSTSKSSPYILNISLKNKQALKVQEQLSEKGIYIATKSACCTLHTPSRPVYALTKDRKRAMQTLRISLGYGTTKEELDEFIDTCEQILLKP